MRRFTVIHLQKNQLDAALPLVRVAAPSLTPERWRAFVEAACCAGGGILAAVAGDSRPHGVAAFRPEETLGHGRSMRVEPIITFEMNQAAPARAALCQALELLALARGCDTLIVSTGSRGYADTQSSKALAWAGLGFDLGSVALVKSLAPRPSDNDRITAR